MLQIIEDPQANYKKGYIKTFRSLDDHWINSNPYYFQAFIRMIMKVNFQDDTVLIEGEIIPCKRGQSVYSLNSWCDIFNKKLAPPFWTIQKIRTFFKLLQRDNMIILEGLRKTTRVTICNYDSYQDNQQATNTQLTDSQHGANTELTTTKELKEYNNDNNEKEKPFNFKKSFLELGVEENIINDWLKVRKAKKGVNTETSFNTIKKQIELSGITANECIKIAASKNWVGFESEWIQKNKTNGQKKTDYSPSHRDDFLNPENLKFG